MFTLLHLLEQSLTLHCIVRSDQYFIRTLSLAFKRRLHPSRCIPPINALVNREGLKPSHLAFLLFVILNEPKGLLSVICVYQFRHLFDT